MAWSDSFAAARHFTVTFSRRKAETRRSEPDYNSLGGATFGPAFDVAEGRCRHANEAESNTGWDIFWRGKAFDWRTGSRGRAFSMHRNLLMHRKCQGVVGEGLWADGCAGEELLVRAVLGMALHV
jgi:hypothetical protein